MPEKPLRSMQHNTAATLAYCAAVPPLAQETTCGERGDVGCVCQLLILDIDLNAAGDLMANALRQTRQHPRKSLSSVIADQSHVRGVKPYQIVRRNRQCVFLQSWIASHQVPNRLATPSDQAAVLHNLRAKEIG